MFVGVVALNVAFGVDNVVPQLSQTQSSLTTEKYELGGDNVRDRLKYKLHIIGLGDVNFVICVVDYS